MKYVMEHSMEMEFKLKQSYENSRTVVHTTNAVTLDDVLEEFQMFLEGCGFHLNGTLEVIPYEHETDASTDYSLD